MARHCRSSFSGHCYPGRIDRPHWQCSIVVVRDARMGSPRLDRTGAGTLDRQCDRIRPVADRAVRVLRQARRPAFPQRRFHGTRDADPVRHPVLHRLSKGFSSLEWHFQNISLPYRRKGIALMLARYMIHLTRGNANSIATFIKLND